MPTNTGCIKCAGIVILAALILSIGLGFPLYANTVSPSGTGANLAAPGAIGGTTSSTGQFTKLAVGASVPSLPSTTGTMTLTESGNSSGSVLTITPDGANDFAKTALILANTGNNSAGINFSGQNDCMVDSASGIQFGTTTCTSIMLTIDHSGNLSPLAAGSIKLTGGGMISATGGAAPTITCSGGSTGTSVTAGSTNNRGQFVTSSSASTNCTLTWSAAAAWPQAPFCVVSDGGASITPTAFSVGATGTSTMVVDFASATSKTVNYVCM